MYFSHLICCHIYINGRCHHTDGLSDHIRKSDVAIIFGSKVNPGGMLSSRLAARLDKGIELYRKGMFNYIIVSGGIGKEGIDEAVAMKTYLLAHQIPAAVIFTITMVLIQRRLLKIAIINACSRI